MTARDDPDSPAPAAAQLPFERLAWLTACLALALLPYVATLPLWVTGLAAGGAVLRLILAARGRGAPPRPIRVGVSLLAIGLLFLQYRTFNGLSAGSALLCLIAGLKLLETQVRRDVHVVTMIIYFLGLAALLQDGSFWLLGYLLGVCWLTTATLLRLTRSAAPVAWRRSVRYSGLLLAQALPVALACWLFFPRFGGPLWQLPNDDGAATSGLGDSMSPGDITDLATSDDVAFRVRFSGASPAPAERYWRGPVLHEFDGRAWRRGVAVAVADGVPPLQFRGPAYEYTVSLEPHQHDWLFVLDWPSRWNAAHARLTGDYMLVQSVPLAQPLDVVATSYTHAMATAPLDAALRRRDTRAPARQSALGAAGDDDARRPSRDARLRACGARDVPGAAVLLHPHAAASGRGLGGRLSVRQPARFLRTLRIGVRHADAGRGHSGARGDRLPGWHLQPLRGLLDHQAERRACVG